MYRFDGIRSCSRRGLKHITRGFQQCCAAGQVFGRYSHQGVAAGHGERPFARRLRGGDIRFLPDRVKKVTEVEELQSTKFALPASLTDVKEISSAVPSAAETAKMLSSSHQSWDWLLCIDNK